MLYRLSVYWFGIQKKNLTDFSQAELRYQIYPHLTVMITLVILCFDVPVWIPRSSPPWTCGRTSHRTFYVCACHHLRSGRRYTPWQSGARRFQTSQLKRIYPINQQQNTFINTCNDMNITKLNYQQLFIKKQNRNAPYLLSCRLRCDKRNKDLSKESEMDISHNLRGLSNACFMDL